MHKCPDSVKKAGAELVKARRKAADLVDQLQVAYKAVKAVMTDMKTHGAREMEIGEALAKIAQAAMVEGLIGAAHDHLRKKLGYYECEEPTDGDIIIFGGGGPR